jgi:hypothetical protein
MEELLVAVHDEVHEAEFAAAVGAMDPAAPPVERLHQLVDAIVCGLEADPRVGRVKILEVFGAGPLVENTGNVACEPMRPWWPRCSLRFAPAATLTGMFLPWRSSLA